MWNLSELLRCILFIYFLDGNSRLFAERHGAIQVIRAMTNHFYAYDIFMAGCAALVGLCLQGRPLFICDCLCTEASAPQSFRAD